jgi:hypothetical protein
MTDKETKQEKLENHGREEKIEMAEFPVETKLEEALSAIERKNNQDNQDLDELFHELTREWIPLSKVDNSVALKVLQNSVIPGERKLTEEIEKEIYQEKSWLPNWLPLPVIRFFSHVDMVKEMKIKVAEKMNLVKSSEAYQNMKETQAKEKAKLEKEELGPLDKTR